MACRGWMTRGCSAGHLRHPAWRPVSARMKGRLDIFGQLQDTPSDGWIDDEQGIEREFRKSVEGRRRANVFGARWGAAATGRRGLSETSPCAGARLVKPAVGRMIYGGGVVELSGIEVLIFAMPECPSRSSKISLNSKTWPGHRSRAFILELQQPIHFVGTVVGTDIGSASSVENRYGTHGKGG